MVYDPLSENTNGLHLNVAAFDFAGLYPAMMISRNISWESKSIEPTEFGVNIKKDTTIIIMTLSTGSGYTSGLYVHDEILAINGNRVSTENVKDRMANVSINEPADFLISRDGLIKTIPVTAGSLPFNKFSIEKVDQPTPRQKQMFSGWLKQDWDA